jgi:hypothetical protein
MRLRTPASKHALRLVFLACLSPLRSEHTIGIPRMSIKKLNHGDHRPGCATGHFGGFPFVGVRVFPPFRLYFLLYFVVVNEGCRPWLCRFRNVLFRIALKHFLWGTHKSTLH